MKTNAILFIGFILLAQSGFSSSTLLLSGVVPVRGFTVFDDISKAKQIRPNQGSELAVYIGEAKNKDRNPQSISSTKKSQNIAAIQNWKLLTGPKALSAINFVRVVAP